MLNFGGRDVDVTTQMGFVVFCVGGPLAQVELEIKRGRVRDSVTKCRVAGRDLGGRRSVITDSQVRSAVRLLESGDPTFEITRDLGVSRAPGTAESGRSTKRTQEDDSERSCSQRRRPEDAGDDGPLEHLGKCGDQRVEVVAPNRVRRIEEVTDRNTTAAVQHRRLLVDVPTRVRARDHRSVQQREPPPGGLLAGERWSRPSFTRVRR